MSTVDDFRDDEELETKQEEETEEEDDMDDEEDLDKHGMHIEGEEEAGI